MLHVLDPFSLQTPKMLQPERAPRHRFRVFGPLTQQPCGGSKVWTLISGPQHIEAMSPAMLWLLPPRNMGNTSKNNSCICTILQAA